jgi:hypothetical protein
MLTGEAAEKRPAPLPNRILMLFDTVLATARSGLPSLLKSLIAID